MKNNYTFGYIRVSSKDQNEERQYKKMINLGNMVSGGKWGVDRCFPCV